MDKLEPKNSGDSIKDCISYVRLKMYHLSKKSGKDEDNDDNVDAMSKIEEVILSTSPNKPSK